MSGVCERFVCVSECGGVSVSVSECEGVRVWVCVSVWVGCVCVVSDGVRSEVCGSGGVVCAGECESGRCG